MKNGNFLRNRGDRKRRKKKKVICWKNLVKSVNTSFHMDDVTLILKMDKNEKSICGFSGFFLINEKLIQRILSLSFLSCELRS